MFVWQFMEHQLKIFEDFGTLMPNPVSFGFPDWDLALGGMYPGDLVVFIGNPGTGKSFTCSEIAYAAVDRKQRVVLANLEMKAAQVTSRYISRQTRIPARKLRRPDAMTDEDRALVKAAMQEFIDVQNTNLFLVPPLRTMNIPMLKMEIETAFADEKPDLIVVDYMNKLDSVKGAKDDASRMKEIAEGLKHLAHYFDCPVVTPTQPSSKGLETQTPGMKDVGYKVVNHEADTMIYLKEDAENRYIGPGVVDPWVGQPGIILAHVIKARNDAKPPMPFKLEVEFATTSIRSADGQFGTTAIGKSVRIDDEVPPFESLPDDD
jgi:replicative DNA helicase